MYRDPACGPEQFWWMSRGWAGGPGAPGGRGFGPGRGGKPWWAEAMGEPPPRAERGGVRFLVLEAIAEQPRHGYEIIQHIEQRAGGSYRPSPGVIYPTLQMLEELEQARVVEQDGRKVYAITDAGKTELETNRSSVDEFYARFKSRMIDPTPSSAPQPIRFQLMSPPSTPLASAEMSAACGAASACSPTPGAPAKPKALLSRSSTGGITSEPKITP